MDYYINAQQRNNWIAWKRTAERYATSADLLFENGYHEISEYNIRHAVELFYKAVCTKENIIFDTRGNAGHKLIKLANLVSGVVYVSGIENTSHIDVSNPSGEGKLIDTYDGGSPELRYPQNGYSPDEYLSIAKVEKTITDCKKIIYELLQKL